jgi:hypothetical protein
MSNYFCIYQIHIPMQPTMAYSRVSVFDISKANGHVCTYVGRPHAFVQLSKECGLERWQIVHCKKVCDTF